MGILYPKRNDLNSFLQNVIRKLRSAFGLASKLRLTFAYLWCNIYKLPSRMDRVHHHQNMACLHRSFVGRLPSAPHAVTIMTDKSCDQDKKWSEPCCWDSHSLRSRFQSTTLLCLGGRTRHPFLARFPGATQSSRGRHILESAQLLEELFRLARWGILCHQRIYEWFEFELKLRL